MATQHPDNARPPYWLSQSFVASHAEVEECFRSFADLGCQEYMWDWEGKFVDEAVVERLFQSYLSYFQEKQLGRDVFLTVRLPNIWQERGYRITRAFMGILTAHDLAVELGLNAPPIIEVILPMTDDPQRLFYIKHTFKQTAQLKRVVFEEHSRGEVFEDIGVIPLIEGIADIRRAKDIIGEYVGLHQKEFGQPPSYLRPFIARSDPALNSGFVPAALLAKMALCEYYRFQEESGIPMHPIIGVGSLPFRGGLRPDAVDSFVAEYPGVRTVTVQSAFRYDFPQEQVVAAIAQLNRTLAETQCQHFDDAAMAGLDRLNDLFAAPYQHAIEALAPTINRVALAVPSRRERLLHVGLFGYSRGIGRVSLPRAIPFAASLYSLGVPPELIGTGRGLAAARREGLLPQLEKAHHQLREHLRAAGRLLNKENLERLCLADNSWEDVAKDVAAIEDYLGERLGPSDPDSLIHRNLTSNILILFQQGQDFTEDLERAARLRRSLG